MLVDPEIIRIFRGTRIAGKAWPGKRVECPSLGALLTALGAWPVERASAFSAVEARDMAAVERHPNHAVAIDVHAANAVSRQRHLVDFRKRRVRRVGSGTDTDDVAGMRQARSPDRTVGWTPGDAIQRKGNARVLGRIQRGAGLVITFVAPAVAVGVDNEGGPTLRRGSVASMCGSIP